MTGPKHSGEWSDLASLIDRLLDAAPEARGTLIAELSGGDQHRRAELEALLAECDRELPLLDAPAAERFAALLDEDARFPDALRERYRPTGEVGRGGMAAVFVAHDVKHGRDVAVKIVRPSIAAGLGAGRFLREIEIAARLRHPHIVPLYDSGEAGGVLYYVMPYEPGLSLRQRLARDGPLASEEVVSILRDICDALAHAHARGIVHRDIKPDNVLLSGRHALITDFGVAKAVLESSVGAAGEPVEADTSRGTEPRPSAPALDEAGISPRGPQPTAALGTPAYMAPEQISGDPGIDHRADIYAVGALGYELLAGAPPFGGLPQDVIRAHLSEVPTPLAERRPEVPAALAALVMRCLAKRPSDRWQSADELVAQLERIAATAGDPIPRASRRWAWMAAAVVALAMVGGGAAVAWRGARDEARWRSRWEHARIEKLTDFPGAEVDATISADGRYVAFLSDRDSVFDAMVTEVRSGRFVNLTGGRFKQLFNEDVRNVGFDANAAHVWIRVADLTSPASVSLLPIGGGAPRPLLPTAVMAVWSHDGSRLAYHETRPGDPIYVADADGRNPRRVFVAPAGLHSHDLTWSPDGRFLYFTHGLPPDEMDVWRVPSDGGAPERITSQNSRVRYPLLLDDRTLLYSATDDEGTGPWLFMMDVKERVATRLSAGVEHYLSIAASAAAAGEPRRLVASVSNPIVNLWTVPLTAGMSAADSARPLPLPTARSAGPRLAPDGSLLYLASHGGADGLWRLGPSGATELWTPSDGAIAGAPAISPDGRQLCLAVRKRGRATLECTSADGRGARRIAESLDVRGAPSWSPDGRWIAVAARDGPAVRVFRIPADGAGPPVRLVDSVSSNPVWSPDGKFILYSGTPRGRSVPLRAVTPDGRAHPLPFPSLLVDRLGDSYRFAPDGRSFVVKLGGFRRQEFWSIDLATGARRRLAGLRPGESVNRFDVSPDGKRIVFERVQENSDVALLELPAR